MTSSTPSTPRLVAISTQMSEESIVLIEYVHAHPGCGFMVLHEQFGGGHALHKMRARVAYLCRAGYLQVTGHSIHQNTYISRLGQPVIHREPITQACAVDSATATIRINLTPPARYDRMHGPVYVPERDNSGRPGALDHQRYASRGFPC